MMLPPIVSDEPLGINEAASRKLTSFDFTVIASSHLRQGITRNSTQPHISESRNFPAQHRAVEILDGGWSHYTVWTQR